GGAQWVPGAAGALTLVIAALVARHQVSYWRDSVTLFERAVAVTERNFLAHNNLGEALAGVGRREEAAIHYAEAVRLHPGYAPARNNQGIVLAEAGRYAEAEQEFRAALALDPGMVIAESNLATARARLGDYQDAIAHYERALAREPSNAVAHEGLADSLALLGRLDEAIVQYREALRWAPGTMSARRSLAGTLRRAGREAEAEGEERGANVTPCPARLDFLGGRFLESPTWRWRAHARSSPSFRRPASTCVRIAARPRWRSSGPSRRARPST